MPTFTFPAATLAVDGDPEAVRETGRAYGRFASTAGEAATSLRGLDSGTWVGTEGDLFRAQVARIPPQLDTAHTAFVQVAGALSTFAEELADAQRQMNGIRADAEQTSALLAGARADRAGLREPSAQDAAADPAARTAYEEHERALEARVDQLQDTWDAHMANAAGVHARLQEAARQSGATIRAAGRISPTHGQNWFEDGWEKGKRLVSGVLDDLKGFIADHASVFRGLAKVMRVIGIALVAVGAVLAALSFVAGVFSFGIGWLGTLPAGTIMQAGFVLWGAGDTLDTTVDWAEGKITGRELLFSAGVSIGLAAVGGAAGKAVTRAARTTRRADDVAMANKGKVPIYTPRERALREAFDDAAEQGIRIHSDDEAEALLDFMARRHGEAPENFHAVTLGDDIFIRRDHADNVRVLREEMIHVSQQRGGISTADVVQGEIDARLEIIANRHRWSITNDEVREMIQEVRKMRATGRY
jgi:hypothetical protein